MSKVLLEADYSQQEIRVVAHCAKCRGLIELFLRGGDPHTETAAKIFGLPLADAKQDKYRYPTKRMNFGVIYGITEEGLAADIEEHIADLIDEEGSCDIKPWSVDDCARLIKEWYKLYPEVKDFRLEQIAHARRYGYVKDMFGRIRFVPEIYCPIQSVQEAGERQAGNMPIQSGSQGITKLGMARLFRERNERKWFDRVKFLMQIHDSIIIESDGELGFVREVARWMREGMTSVVSLLVPLEVDVKIGLNWGEMEKLDIGKTKEINN